MTRQELANIVADRMVPVLRRYREIYRAHGVAMTEQDDIYQRAYTAVHTEVRLMVPGAQAVVNRYSADTLRQMVRDRVDRRLYGRAMRYPWSR